MQIELKNIKVEHELSAATHYFDADLFVNGKAVVHIHDRGYGDPFVLTPLVKDGLQLYKAANDWCLKNQTELINVYQVTPLTEDPVDLSDLISDLLQQDLEGALLREHQTEMEKAMARSILYGVPGRLLYHRFLLDSPVELLLSTKTGTDNLRRSIIHGVIPKMTAEERILNTNIPAETMHNMRLPADRIPQTQATALEKKTKKTTAPTSGDRAKTKKKKR